MNYRKPLLRSALATCVLLAAGCQTWDATFNSATQPFQAVVAQTNDTIIGQLVTLNKTEIDQSKLAMSKAHHRSVKAYAAKIHKGHSMGLKETLQVSKQTGIQPVMSVTTQNIENQSAQQISQLKTLTGNAFDKAFIDIEIQNHKGALTQIDEDIKLSTNPKLTKLLKISRQHVAQHLHMAEKIQKQLTHGTM